jgi:hypothetical protein
MIYILWATIRPTLFITNHKRWMKSAFNPRRIKTLVAVNTEEQKQELLNYNSSLEIKVCGEGLGICKPIYELTRDLKADDTDTIIVVSDDVDCFYNWDIHIRGLYTIFSGCLFFNDGVQDIRNIGNPAITMPVMDYKTLKILNFIIFHPDYKHYFSDNELYRNVKDLGLLTDLRDDKTVFQHEHFDIGKRERDSHDLEIITNCSDIDRDTYYRRMNLPVEERIKL